MVSFADITSGRLKPLCEDMHHTLVTNKLGVGLAAPQVGQNIALFIVAVRPSAHRPEAKPFDLIMINPKITKYFGHKKAVWEGCISSGSNGTADLFAKVPRYTNIEVEYYDANAKHHQRKFEDLHAQIIQHEIDHLNGVLFVDRVKDTKTYCNYKQYMKHIAKTVDDMGFNEV